MVKVHGVLQQKKHVNTAGKLVPVWCFKTIDLVLEDIKRFIALHDNDKSVPFRGSNMTGKGANERMAPIKVTFSAEDWETITDAHDGSDKGDKAHFNHIELREILKTSAIIENKNPDTQAEITRILSLATPFKIHHNTTKPLPKHDGKTAIQALRDAFIGNYPLKSLGPGLGVVQDELVIFPDGKTFYIIFTMPSTIGETTRREVFSKKIPDNVYTVNGEFGIKIPATIAVDADVFIGVISECVQISRGANHLLVPNFISPIKLGIFLTDDIFAKIQPGGEIYQALLQLGIVLQYKRAPGPRGTSGVRLSRISWTITDDTQHIPVATPLGTPLDFEGLECSTYTKFDETFHNDVPMIISVYADE
jgi:hypothetical protein